MRACVAVGVNQAEIVYSTLVHVGYAVNGSGGRPRINGRFLYGSCDVNEFHAYTLLVSVGIVLCLLSF